ncbi:MAG TPA: Ig-like domain-containing protein [Mobilitalea sp.]|nr:Ig-like domain-containing protein [Mobilitalea sp.]
MKKNFILKCVISLGLILFLSMLLPYKLPNSTSIAYATEIEKDNSDDNRLYFKKLTLVKGKSFLLKVKDLSENAKVSFKSADPEIASLSNEGVVLANQVGETTVTVTIKDGLNTITSSCSITVGPPAFSVKIARSRFILGVTESDTVSVIKKPINTTEDVGFSSLDINIADINPYGRITGVSVGFTYVFAQIDALNSDGFRKFSKCSVIVVNQEDLEPLKLYFNDHPELSLISEDDLSLVLAEFFNSTTVEAVEPSSTPTPAVKVVTEALSLVESLDNFLNTKYDLADLRKQRDDFIANLTTNQ